VWLSILTRLFFLAEFFEIMAYYQYIDPRELADLLHNDQIAIIDVRDEDFDEDGLKL
jgi:hypothetical protein